MAAGGTKQESSFGEHYVRVRRFTEQLCEPLETEDYVIHSMPDVSPVKWHLAHTTWFFETFVLARGLPGYRPYHPLFNYLFNSYYNSIGPRGRARSAACSPVPRSTTYSGIVATSMSTCAICSGHRRTASWAR